MKPGVKPAIDDSALHQAGIGDEDVAILVAFQASGEWQILQKLMKYLKFQADLKLRSPLSTMEEIRHHQGRLGSLNELANLIEVDLPEWYKMGTRSKGGR